MSEIGLFFGKFLRHGTAIASLAPSSRWLSRATVRAIDWDNAQTILELGAGTGPITRELARRVRPTTRVIAIERDPDFVRVLRSHLDGHPSIEIVEGDVASLPALLADRGIQQVDEIVSGLPVPSFSATLRDDLMRHVARYLKESGGFHQITEMPLVYWRFYKRYFHDVRFVFEPRNFPPAGAYVCRGPRALP